MSILLYDIQYIRDVVSIIYRINWVVTMMNMSDDTFTYKIDHRVSVLILIWCLVYLAPIEHWPWWPCKWQQFLRAYISFIFSQACVLVEIYEIFSGNTLLRSYNSFKKKMKGGQIMDREDRWKTRGILGLYKFGISFIDVCS